MNIYGVMSVLPRMAPRTKSIDDQNIDLRSAISAFQYIPRLIGEIWHVDRGLMVVHVLARSVQAAMPVAMLWVGKLIIDEIIHLTQDNGLLSDDTPLLWRFVAIELALALVSDILNRLVNLTDGLIGDKYAYRSSTKIIRKTNELSMAQLEDSAFYDKLERARRQTTNRVALITNILQQLQSLVSILSLLLALIYFEPWLVVLLVLSIIPAFMNELKFGFVGYSLARSWTSERRELDYLRYIGANYITAKEIKLFGLTEFIAQKFQKLSEDYYLLNRAIAQRKAIWGAGFNILSALAYYGAYILIIIRVIGGLITIGDLTFLTGSFAKLRTSLQNMFSRFTKISQSVLYLSDYYEYLDIPITENRAHPRAAEEVPEDIQYGFRFEDVSFSYPGTDVMIIEELTFDLPVGEKLALVGENGAGKTTLIKLLLRFYQPTSGRITLDGIDIEEYDLDAYRRCFGVIFQDFFKYEFTVLENIAVGNIEKLDDREHIELSAEQSLATQVVEELPEGYEQQLGKRFKKGYNLSGGQWQKIALARAYMKNAQVMILDEPTSALDAKAEYEVFERFMNLTKGKTSVIISHRFSTVRMATKILVLKNGRLHEMGTHEELMNNDKLYAELFSLQASGYQ